MNTYWGEMHTHTFCGDGSWSSIEEGAATAKEHLDFWMLLITSFGQKQPKHGGESLALRGAGSFDLASQSEFL